MIKGWVLYNEEIGVFLGECLGLGFWSQLDSCGQNAAITFPNKTEATKMISHMKQNDTNLAKLAISPILVEVDDGDNFATIQSCMRAGIPGWVYDKTLST